VIPITVMRRPKRNSSLRNPYLSSNRNVKVSTTVMRTPAQSGILYENKNRSSLVINSKCTTESLNVLPTLNLCEEPRGTYILLESRKIAMAVPITSCISEPMMATSTINHRRIRGILRYCL